MTYDELLEYALSLPGAWRDEPWEGDTVAKVGDKIFAFLGADEIDSDQAQQPGKQQPGHDLAQR